MVLEQGQEWFTECSPIPQMEIYTAHGSPPEGLHGTISIAEMPTVVQDQVKHRLSDLPCRQGCLGQAERAVLVLVFPLPCPLELPDLL